MKKYSLLIVLIMKASYAYCQTFVKGTVTDSSNQPIPLANVTFNGQNQSVKTDTSGVFYLTSEKNFNTITVSCIGFQKKTIALTQASTHELNIVLHNTTTTLNEVRVVSGSAKKRIKKKQNPAYVILENIWKNKKKNGLKLFNFYEYDKYVTTELGFDNLDSLFIKKALTSDYDSVSRKIVKDPQKNKYFVPFELIEKTEKVYGSTLLHKEKTATDGERDVGIKQQGKILDKITHTFKEIDIYQNDIEILSKTFVSPISTQGFGTYEYTLGDSVLEEGKKFYTIHYYPRQTRDFAFYGSFKVADKSFVIVDIDMRTPKKMNLNFVRNFEFKKTYSPLNDSVYLPAKNEYQGYFSLLTKDEKGIYVVRKETFSNYVFNIPQSTDFYDKIVVQTNAHQFDKDPQYWLKLEDKETATVNEVVNKVKNSKKINNVTGIIYTLSDGYINAFDGIQLGNIWASAARNDVEGIRLRFGFRTFKTENDLLKIESYTAYGLHDKKTKFGFEARYLLANNPRITISAAYLNDNEQMGLTQFNGSHLIPEAARSSKALFNRGRNYFISHIEKKMLRFDFEPIKNLHIGITATHNNIESAAPRRFSQNHLDLHSGQIKSQVTDATSDVYITYTPQKISTGFGVDEKEAYTLHPTLMLNFKRGYKGILGSNFNYNRLQVQYNNPIVLGKFGILDATLGSGKTFEALPLSILTAISSNQTYFLLPNTFALLDYYDFVADTYVEGHFEHHLNSFLLNRIPVIKKLNLRSLLTFRGVYGTISNGSKEINRSSIIYVAPTKPYFEYGFGFENIGYGNIRPLRIDFITRSDFENFNGPPNPKHGLRLSIRANF
ncbi:MAG: carboxypeptidase-like regulatory domain-containing protein [Sphingobacteriales bacterium]|nr:MAG: carboxypeptidase-like regulatory domain-containing protein [Sphingobacteriales bacterium]